MRKQAPVNYTVRGVPGEVDRVLRQRAKQPEDSLNQVLVDELTFATIGHPKRADFTDLAGHWTPDPAFDEILASQRRIDAGKWK